MSSTYERQLAAARRRAIQRWRETDLPQAVVALDDGGEFGERSIVAMPIADCCTDEFLAFDGRIIEEYPLDL